MKQIVKVYRVKTGHKVYNLALMEPQAGKFQLMVGPGQIVPLKHMPSERKVESLAKMHLHQSY